MAIWNRERSFQRKLPRPENSVAEYAKGTRLRTFPVFHRNRLVNMCARVSALLGSGSETSKIQDLHLLDYLMRV